MRRIAFEHSFRIRGTKVPAGPDWIYEIKHDGYRLIVQRDGKRMRLFTRNGYDWSDRYPSIVEAALRNRRSSFEAALLRRRRNKLRAIRIEGVGEKDADDNKYKKYCNNFEQWPPS